MSDPTEDAIWYCKIGPVSRGDLPSNSDAPMAKAVRDAFRKLTGHDDEFAFTGWGAKLTEAELAVVEGRPPRPRVIAAEARAQILQAEAVIGTDLDPDGTTPTEPPSVTDGEQPYSLAYMAWVLLANVSGGDWTKQTPEWQEAVARWRDEFHANLADGTPPTEPAANGLEPGEIVAVPADLRNDPDGVQWECYFAGYWLPVQADDTARRICRPITEEGQS